MPEDYPALLAELDRQRRRHQPRLPPGAGADRLRPHRRLRRGGVGLAGARRSARRRRAGARSRGGWRRRCATARTRTRRRPSTATAARGPGVATARQLQGKALSYNNINDTDAAFELVAEFAPEDGPACAIVKHANPCGVARGGDAGGGLPRGLRLRPHLGLRRHRGAEPARSTPRPRRPIAEIFTEVVIAPDATEAAARSSRAKKNLRLLRHRRRCPTRAAPGARLAAGGGRLPGAGPRQRRLAPQPTCGWSPGARRPRPSSADLRFAWTVAKHVKSNAIVYARGGATVGIGAGQMSRVDCDPDRRAQGRATWPRRSGSPSRRPSARWSRRTPSSRSPTGCVAAAEAGATAVIQPGGSVRDAEVIAAADAAGLAMVFTGMRHFRH